jgi:hypothetical protein
VTAYEVLAAHGFAAPEAGLRVSIVAAGASRGLLWDGRLALPAPAHSAATRLVERVRRELRDGEIGSVGRPSLPDPHPAGHRSTWP